MGKADFQKTAGILAFVAGIAQMLVGLVFAVGDSVTGSISSGLELFGLGGRGVGGPSFVWGLIFAYATLVIGAFLLSGARGRVPGIALVVSAVLGAFGGSAFALLAILSITGGVVALIGGFGAGGDGFRGLAATARRMAEAAKEADASDGNAPKG